MFLQNVGIQLQDNMIQQTTRPCSDFVFNCLQPVSLTTMQTEYKFEDCEVFIICRSL
jgi:hypothetical protein